MIVARAGETNHVPLLIGVAYSVTSSVPFTVGVPDTLMNVEIDVDDDRHASVRWPLNVVWVAAEGGGHPVRVGVERNSLPFQSALVYFRASALS